MDASVSRRKVLALAAAGAPGCASLLQRPPSKQPTLTTPLVVTRRMAQSSPVRSSRGAIDVKGVSVVSTPVAFSPLLMAFLDLSVILGAVRLPQTGHRHTLRTHVGFGGRMERPPINHPEARAARSPNKLAVLNKCRVKLRQNPAPQAGLISRRVEPCVDWATIVGGVEPRVDRA